ncbi:MAG TPA: tRNA lysidine(34) synthetase TilS [Actinobacteria bacterium]|nr:tRNA lysidine(34) synthetase TilS [Actinomycetota bacterium]
MAGAGGVNATELRRRVTTRVPPGAVTVALSGGADSAVLAWALADRADVTALTIDHGLPGSAALVAAADRIASQLGLRHRVAAVAPRSATEGDLRTARLAALEGESSGWIVTGHTADDQAETVLGNLLRGAGPGGLAGIPVRRGRFVRPLLDVRRTETRSLAAELGLPFADDPQNEDLGVRRNRIRTETLPALAAAYNPRLSEALVRAGAALAADDALLEERATRVPLRRDEEAVLIPASALTQLPAAMAARVVRRGLRLLLGDHAGDAAAITGALAAAAGSGVATLRGGLDARREGPWLAIAGPPPPLPEPVELSLTGPTRFGAWLLARGGPVQVPVSGPALVRAVRPGDRIAMGRGSKLVAEALREAGVPERLRRRWPVVEEHGRIAWVVGVRVAPGGAEAGVAMAARREPL